MGLHNSRKRGRMVFSVLLVLIVIGTLHFYMNGYEGHYGRTQREAEDTHAKQKIDVKEDWEEKANAVKEAFVYSWQGYSKYAWGKDEYHPISRTSKNMVPKGLGWIIIDSLDTMMLMNLTSELKQGREWVKTELDFNQDNEVNLFETTIRMLGGLLSAYYLSNDSLYLDKAIDLGDRLMKDFDSPSGIPYASINLKTGKARGSHTDAGSSSLAEATTIQLEFKYLSYLTGNMSYWKAADKVMRAVENMKSDYGLVPIFISPRTGDATTNEIRLGSRGDSYYEYLLKQYIQTSRNEPVFRELYDEAMDGVKRFMLQETRPSHYMVIGELQNGVNGGVSNKMDHLVCFLGGCLALGATYGLSPREANLNTKSREDLHLGALLTETCYRMYADMPNGLAPEIVYYNTNQDSDNDFIVQPRDRHNLMRPETVESIFILWRITKDVKYRKWGWEIFKAFQKWSIVEGAGYTSLDDVITIPPKKRDNMESFWVRKKEIKKRKRERERGGGGVV